MSTLHFQRHALASLTARFNMFHSHVQVGMFPSYYYVNNKLVQSPSTGPFSGSELIHIFTECKSKSFTAHSETVLESNSLLYTGQISAVYYSYRPSVVPFTQIYIPEFPLPHSPSSDFTQKYKKEQSENTYIYNLTYPRL